MLVDQIAAGDRRAMQMLYSKHHMRVYRFLRGLVRDEELTEGPLAKHRVDATRAVGISALVQYPTLRKLC